MRPALLALAVVAFMAALPAYGGVLKGSPVGSMGAEFELRVEVTDGISTAEVLLGPVDLLDPSRGRILLDFDEVGILQPAVRLNRTEIESGGYVLRGTVPLVEIPIEVSVDFLGARWSYRDQENLVVVGSTSEMRIDQPESLFEGTISIDDIPHQRYDAMDMLVEGYSAQALASSVVHLPIDPLIVSRTPANMSIVQGGLRYTFFGELRLFEVRFEQVYDVAPEFLAIDLGGLGGDPDLTLPRGINNRTQVVGLGRTDQGARAFLWERNDMMELSLATAPTSSSQGWAINDHGQALLATSGRVFLWRDGDERELDGLDFAFSINNLSQVAGVRGTEPLIWDNGRLTALPFLPGQNRGTPWDINDLGQVVGEGTNEAILWDSGSAIPLPPIGSCTIARGLNNLGQIVGMCDHQGVIWEGDTAQKLGRLPYLRTTEPLAISDAGKVVGIARSGEQRAFIWDDATGMRDLNDLVELPEGMVLLEAWDINAQGEVVANGRTADSSDTTRGILLVPVPEASPVEQLVVALLAICLQYRCRPSRACRSR